MNHASERNFIPLAKLLESNGSRAEWPLFTQYPPVELSCSYFRPYGREPVFVGWTEVGAESVTRARHCNVAERRSELQTMKKQRIVGDKSFSLGYAGQFNLSCD